MEWSSGGDTEWSPRLGFDSMVENQTVPRLPMRRMAVFTVMTTIATFSCSSATPNGSPQVPQRHHDIACSIGVANPEAVPVTMRDLLDHPERYADKFVRTEAYMTSAFEDNELRPLDDNYQELPSQLTQAEWSRRCPADPRGGHAQGIVPLRSVWWEPSASVFSGPRGIVDACNLRDVIIEGVFRFCETGHMGGFAGTIDDATYVIDR